MEEPAVFAASLPTSSAANDLQDEWRPVAGGPELDWEEASSGNRCTLGFNGDHNGKRAFATNGHCTNVHGGSEGTGFAQDDWLLDFIGVEYFEEEWFGSSTDPDCPTSLPRCKYTDLALGEYDEEIDWHFPFVFRPVNRHPFQGSIDVDPVLLRIELERLRPLQGDTVDKIGRTTGWPYGEVTESCATRTVKDAQGIDRHFTCTYEADGGAQGGDSGSGVYFWDGEDGLEITGQLFAGSPSGQGFLFSPWNNISVVTSYLDAKWILACASRDLAFWKQTMVRSGPPPAERPRAGLGRSPSWRAAGSSLGPARASRRPRTLRTSSSTPGFRSSQVTRFWPS